MLANLKLVLKALAAAGAVLNLEKSNFLAEEFEYLGYIIDATGIKPNPKTTEAIQQYPRPKTTKQIQRFLGLAGYLRKFSPKQAECEKIIRQTVHQEKIVAPNYQNDRKQPQVKSRVIWTEAAEVAFLTIKEMLNSECKLARYNPQWKMEVHCDASASCLGSILAQRDEQGISHVLQYASKTLNPAEQNYPNTDRELLAIKWAVTEKFRPYLESGKFIIYTDHQPLLGELKLKNPSKRCLKFLMELEEYEFELKHKPGHLLSGPDALSRMTEKTSERQKQHVSYGAAAKGSSKSEEQHKAQLIHDYHESLGHSNWKKTLDGIRRRFQWSGMRQDIWEYCNKCSKCFDFNSATKKIGTKLEFHEVTKPRQRIGIDFYGPLPKTKNGNKYAIMAIDYMSKFMVAKPVPVADTNTAIDFIESIIEAYGKCDEIITDNGAQFRRHFREYFAAKDIAVHNARTSHFEGNGMIERGIKTIGEIQAKNGASAETWDEYLWTNVQRYNATSHTATGECPGDVFFGEEFKCIADQYWKPPPRSITPIQQVQQHLEHYQKTLQHQTNRNRRPPFVAGDKIAVVRRLANSKKHSADRRFRKRKEGPYTVVGFNGHGQYRVTNGIKEFCTNAFEMIPWDPKCP
jgi:hypothetical protein